MTRVLPLLTDQELHELAGRAQALESDPSAGSSSELAAFLKVMGLLLLVLVVVSLVALSHAWISDAAHSRARPLLH